MKYYIVSDIHSYYDELEIALKENGYNKDNPENTLVVLGDLFDRGPKSLELYKFLVSIPENNLILVKGNHEDIFTDLVNSPFPDEVDFDNGTIDTFCQLAKVNKKELTRKYWQRIFFKRQDFDIDEALYSAWKIVTTKIKNSDVYKFISSNKWKDYFEIGNYVCVHGFIPTKGGEYNPNWRTESKNSDWLSARWSSGASAVYKGLFDEEYSNGKILVCGHVGSLIVRNWLEDRNDIDDSSILFDEKYIDIDASTYLSKKVNVLVINKDENGKVEVVNGR